MAKVMISLPDELLAQVDALAREQGSTRSATIRRLSETALGARQRELSARMAELEGRAIGRGGEVAEQLKRSRPR